MTEKSTNPFKKIINSLFATPADEGQMQAGSSNLPTPAAVSASNVSTESSIEIANNDEVSTTEAEVPTGEEVFVIEPPIAILPELSRTLHDIIQQVPGCEALAYVDIQQGQLIGIETKDSIPDSVRQLVAGATMELFTAPHVVKISEIFKAKKGQPESQSNFNEIIVHGDGNIYVFMRAQSRSDRVGVFSCDNSVSSGMVLHHARQLMPQIELAAEAAFLSE